MLAVLLMVYRLLVHYKSVFHVFHPIPCQRSITLHCAGGWNPTTATIRNKIFVYDKPFLWIWTQHSHGVTKTDFSLLIDKVAWEFALAAIAVDFSSVLPYTVNCRHSTFQNCHLSASGQEYLGDRRVESGILLTSINRKA